MTTVPVAEIELLITAITGAVGSIFGAAVTGLVALLAYRAKSKRADERTAIGYYRGLIDDLQAQLHLHAAQMADSQKAFDLLRRAGADCEREQEALWAEIVRQHEYGTRVYAQMVRCIEALKRLGQDVGPPEEPLEPPRRKGRSESKAAAEFAVRTAEQGAAVLGDLDAKTKDTRS